MKTRTAFIVEPKKIEILEKELPPIGNGDILLKLDSTGLCHSDLTRYFGTGDLGVSPEGYRAVIPVRFPAPLGHEPVATVLETGKDVRRFRVGDKVTGRFTPAFTEYAVVPENGLMSVISDTDKPYSYCLGEPLGAIVNIINCVMNETMLNVAVIGCGFMGLLTIAGLRECNIKRLVGVDLLDWKLSQAIQYGATHTINSASDDARKIAYEITEGRFFDVVVELTGSLKGLETACNVLKYAHVDGMHGNPYQGPGRIISSSVYSGQERFPVSLAQEFVIKTPHIIVGHPPIARNIMDNIEQGIDGYLSGKLPLDSMITHTIGFDELAQGFHWLEKMPDRYIKGVVLYE